MNSSMLSFNGWRRYLSLPLEVHIWHLILLICAMAVLLTCGVFLVRLDPKAAPAKTKWERCITAQVLFLGNSQHTHLDTTQFCRPTCNVKVAGSDYSILFAILKSLTPRMPELNTVVLGFDNLLLQVPAIRNREGDYEKLLQWGVAWWDIPEISFKERVLFFMRHNCLLKPVLTGPKLDQPKLANHLSWKRIKNALTRRQTSAVRHSKIEPLQKEKESKTSEPRNDVNKVYPPFSYAPAEGKKRMAGYLSYLSHHNNTEVNRIALTEMLAYCRDRGIRVVFLRTPTTKAFWGSRSPEWDEELDQLYSEAINVYGSEIPLWDEERSYDYDDHQFRDPNHLMIHYVRTILTPRINKRLLRFY